MARFFKFQCVIQSVVQQFFTLFIYGFLVALPLLVNLFRQSSRESSTMHNNEFAINPVSGRGRNYHFAFCPAHLFFGGMTPSVIHSVRIYNDRTYLLIKVICCPVPSVLLRISSYPRGDRWTVIQLDTITGLATPHLHI